MNMPLKKLIEDSKYTQSSFARHMGVCAQQVNKWCNRGWPNHESMPKIADALGCTTDAIYGRDLSAVGTPVLMAELGRRTGD